MKDEPDIIKELRDAEKLNVFQSKLQSEYEKLETVEDPSEDVPDKSVGFVEDDVGYETTDKQERINDVTFKTMLDFISDSVYSLDKEWRYTLVNKAAAQLVKMSKEKMIGNKLTDLFPGVENTDFFKTYQKVMKTGKQDVVINEFVMPDGSKGWYEVKVYPVPGGIICVASDFAEQKKAEEKLKQSEEKYRIIFENTGAATVIIEEDKTISLANNGFMTLSGFSQEEIKGKKKWTDFVVKEDLERMKKQHSLRRKNTEASLKNYEFRFINKGGAVKNIFLTVDMIPGTMKSAASLLDITERKKAEGKLKEKLDELQRWKKVIVGRELKMAGMKKEMRELKQKSQEGK